MSTGIVAKPVGASRATSDSPHAARVLTMLDLNGPTCYGARLGGALCAHQAG